MVCSGRWIVVLFLAVSPMGASTVSAQEGTTVRYWVFFTDKVNSGSYSAADLEISPRALQRRAKVREASRLIDLADVPVSSDHLQRLRSSGGTVRAVSRWLNAASVDWPRGREYELTAFPFVRSIQPLFSARKQVPVIAPDPAPFSKWSATAALDYGVAGRTQLANIRVIDVHALGINGQGVIVAMLDDGFNNHRSHVALKDIPIVAEYDFVQRDSNTSRAPGEYAPQGNHGTVTLSALAGFENGQLIGSSYGISVILGKTEVDSVEIAIELDYYVEGLEWAERMGADIISTSLGYDDMDPMGVYNPGDITYGMKDGNTAVTSVAASQLAAKGVLLVTAMGNEGRWRKNDSWQSIPGTTGSLITPADATDIVAVGATFSDGILADFSSTGPTADGRTKPEVVAQGVSVRSADPNSLTGYVHASGTSLSTPLVAGVAALVLSAHPHLTPHQVREALMSTARQVQDFTDPTRSSSYPNNYYGEGMVDAHAAVLYHGPAISNRPIVRREIVSAPAGPDTSYVLSVWIASSTSLVADSTALYYKHRSSDAEFQKVLLFSTGGTREYYTRLSAAAIDSLSVGYFTTADIQGRSNRIPSNAPDSMWTLAPTPESALVRLPAPGATMVPTGITLYPNYPNPFNSGTFIMFTAPSQIEAEVAVFNILGQRVKTLYRGGMPNAPLRWDGTDSYGRRQPTGMYLCRLTADGTTHTGKMLLVR